MRQRGDVSKSVSQHGMQTVNETLGNVQSDKQLSHTFPVQMLKDKRLDLSGKEINTGTEVDCEESRAAAVTKYTETTFWLRRGTTASLELPQDCCFFEHTGTCCCQETFYMIFHFVDNCRECCPSTLF